MSNTADVILAVGPSIVALAALGGAAWQQSRTFRHTREITELGFRHQREEADLADVRAIIDDATVTLHRADFGARDFIDAIEADPARASGASDFRAVVREWAEALSAPHERLAVRLGLGHPAVEAINSARGDIWDMEKATTEETIMDAYERLGADRQHFLEESRAIVGSRMPSDAAPVLLRTRAEAAPESSSSATPTTAGQRDIN
jgi:hypothetical protein